MVDALIQNFVAELDGDVLLQLMRFDTEANEEAPRYVDKDTIRSITLRPKMPMRDAFTTALAATEARSSNRQVIVVLASQEFYPSLLTRGQVISAARQREVPVYSIVLRRPDEAESSFLKLFVKALSVVPIWLVESVLDEDRSPTPRETSGLLHGIANATGGRMYTATGSEDAKAYVTAIASEIRTIIR
jgi:hypothetical protein